jgi:ABC-type antimicrobial peptide transport system permease subunit
LLAVTGVVIGVCAIISMLSIGFGMQTGFRDMIESWGNLHMITVYRSGGDGGMWAQPETGGGNSKQIKLDDKAISQIEKIPGVGGASPREEAYLTFGIGKYIGRSSVVGIRPDILEKFNYGVQSGRLLQDGDKYAIVFGNQVPSTFYNPKKTWGSSWAGGAAPVDVVTDKIVVTADWSYGMPASSYEDPSANNDKIVYKQYSFKGVGVLEESDNYDLAYACYAPIDVVKKIIEEQAASERTRYDKSAGYSQAMVYVDNIDNVKRISDAIREMGLQTSSMNDLLENMQKQAAMIQAVLGGIGAISLLVAALGITNTMIMSIYERTKEIGVMKVIGANLPDIKKLFLVEAALIGFVGGMAGIFLSYLVSLLLNTALLPVFVGLLGLGSEVSRISIIPLWLPLAGLGFSTVIGVLSGYSPARRAMNLSALESLRNE